MRIHSDTLTRDAVEAAARAAGAGFIRLEEHGSRSRARAYDVVLSGHGITGGQYGTTAGRTASWDEWGIFLAAIFRSDPGATVPGVYFDAEHFRWSTAGRYDTLTPAEQCKRHRWAYEGRSVTGAYYVHACKRQCGARRRFLAAGHSWGEIGGAA